MRIVNPVVVAGRENTWYGREGRMEHRHWMVGEGREEGTGRDR